MSIQLTPSKQVREFNSARHKLSILFASCTIANAYFVQAASAIDTLKMSDSPAKKIDFGVLDKENRPYDVDAPVVDDIVTVHKPAVEEEVQVAKPLTRVEEIRAMEAEEPLLQENKRRFVLFPLKYHEVSRVHASRVECFELTLQTDLADVQEGRGILLDS